MTAKRTRGKRPNEALPLGRSRLQKLLAATGFGSRRTCEELLRDGRVEVNGQLAKLGDSADPAVDRIRLDGESLVFDKPSYWIVNKPKGVLTTVRDPEGRMTVIKLLPRDVERLFPVGRLDVDTEGLLLLTNDGGMSQSLLHPSLGCEREYEVVVRGDVDDKAVRRLEHGVRLEDGVTGPTRVTNRMVDPDTGVTKLRLILREGRNRQIRRSLMVLGHPVKRLVRVRMGPLKLGRLPRGKARPLRSEEIAALRKHCRELAAGPRTRSRSAGRAASARASDEALPPKVGARASRTVSAQDGVRSTRGAAQRKPTAAGRPASGARPGKPAKGTKPTRGARGTAKPKGKARTRSTRTSGHER